MSTAPAVHSMVAANAGAGRADAVDQDPANDRQRNVGQAEHRVERADLLLAEAALVAQQLGDRGNRVVRIVASHDRECGQGEHDPFQLSLHDRHVFLCSVQPCALPSQFCLHMGDIDRLERGTRFQGHGRCNSGTLP